MNIFWYLSKVWLLSNKRWIYADTYPRFDCSLIRDEYMLILIQEIYVFFNIFFYSRWNNLHCKPPINNIWTTRICWEFFSVVWWTRDRREMDKRRNINFSRISNEWRRDYYCLSCELIHMSVNSRCLFDNCYNVDVIMCFLYVHVSNGLLKIAKLKATIFRWVKTMETSIIFFPSMFFLWIIQLKNVFV